MRGDVGVGRKDERCAHVCVYPYKTVTRRWLFLWAGCFSACLGPEPGPFPAHRIFLSCVFHRACAFSLEMSLSHAGASGRAKHQQPSGGSSGI